MNSVGDHPQGAGFPHSEIHGSKSARLSPWLIAACYVLHRLSVPRHPPDALITLDHYQAFTRHFLQQIPSHAGTSPAMTGVQPVTDKTALRRAPLAGHEDTNCDDHEHRHRFRWTSKSLPGSDKQKLAE